MNFGRDGVVWPRSYGPADIDMVRSTDGPVLEASSNRVRDTTFCPFRDPEENIKRKLLQERRGREQNLLVLLLEPSLYMPPGHVH